MKEHLDYPKVVTFELFLHHKLLEWLQRTTEIVFYKCQKDVWGTFRERMLTRSNTLLYVCKALALLAQYF